MTILFWTTLISYLPLGLVLACTFMKNEWPLHPLDSLYRPDYATPMLAVFIATWPVVLLTWFLVGIIWLIGKPLLVLARAAKKCADMED